MRLLADVMTALGAKSLRCQLGLAGLDVRSQYLQKNVSSDSVSADAV